MSKTPRGTSIISEGPLYWIMFMIFQEFCTFLFLITFSTVEKWTAMAENMLNKIAFFIASVRKNKESYESANHSNYSMELLYNNHEIIFTFCYWKG